MYTINDLAAFLTSADNDIDDLHPDAPTISIHRAPLAGHLQITVRTDTGELSHYRVVILPDDPATTAQ